jgi:uncharacterized protein (DUF885 family)
VSVAQGPDALGTDPFDEAVAEYLQATFEEHPTTAAFLGRTEWDHQLGDSSATGFERRESAAQEWLNRFSAFTPSDLTSEQQIDLSLLSAHLGEQVATADFDGWRRNATTYLSNGVFELFVHGNRSEADATAAALDRLAQVPAALEAGRENLDPTLIDPELLRQWGVPNVAAQANFMRSGLGVFVNDPDRRQKLAAAGLETAAAYEAFGEFLTELADRATGSFAFGETRYDIVLKVGEGFAFGAWELREMGRQQMQELDDRMSALAEKIGGTSDWRAVVNSLRADHPSDMDDLLRCYRA